MADQVPDVVTRALPARELAPVTPATAAPEGSPGARTGGATPAPATSWLSSAAVAAVPWIVARGLVVAALVVARQLVRSLHITDPVVRATAHQGLLSWDAGWYAGISSRGYGALPREALRFFPLVPAVARGLHLVLPLSTRAALVAVANASALVLGVLLHRLVLRESGDSALARRSAWLVALAPPAYVLVLGYAEALATSLAVGAFLALRNRRWWWAAGLAFLAGTARPLNVLLVVPALIEVWRPPRPTRVGSALGRAAAVAAAPAGAAAYLAWVAGRFGDALLPARIQQQRGHRGRLELPSRVVARAVGDVVHGRHLGQALHLPWILLLAGLLVVLARRWPASYTAYAGAVLLLSLSSVNLDSLERYALGAFPFVVAGAWLSAAPRKEGAVLALAAAGMGAYAVLAFLNVVVP